MPGKIHHDQTRAHRSVAGRPPRATLALSLALALAVVAPVAVDAQVLVVPLDSAFTHDAHLRREDPTRAVGANSNMKIGFDGSRMYRTVIRFDTHLVPLADSVVSVHLVFDINRNDLDGSPMTVSTHPLLERFMEGDGIDGVDVSWMHRMSSIPWTNPGTTYDPGTVSRTKVGTTADSLVIDITTMFQAWVADTSQNHGVVIGDSVYFDDPGGLYSGDDFLRIGSTSNPDESQRPYLIVNYGLAIVTPTTTDSSCVRLDSAFTQDARAESGDLTLAQGTDAWTRAGNKSGDVHRTFLRFSVDSFSKLTDITGATITWPIKDNKVNTTQVFEAYPLLEQFREGQGFDGLDASWLHRESGIPWTNAGGTYDSSTVSVFNISPGDTAVTFDITQAVRMWAADTTTNHGIVVGKHADFLNPGPGSEEYVDLWSTEEAGVNRHPTVCIYYDSTVFTTSVIDDVTGEIEPWSLTTSTLDTLTLWIDHDFWFGDEGVDLYHVDMPSGFTLVEVITLRWWGFSFWQYDDYSTPGAITLNTWSEFNWDGKLEIEFAVQTPSTPTVGGAYFNPRVGNSSTSNWQIVPEGNADWNPGDWDQLRVDVAAPKTTVTIVPDTAYTTTDAAYGFTALWSDSAKHTENWTHEGGLGTIDSLGVFDAHTVGTGTVIVNEGSVADTAVVIVDYGAWVDLFLTPADTFIVSDDGAATFTATVMDADSNFYSPPNGSVSWSEPRGLGSFDDPGEFESTTAGTTYVWASYGGVTDSARVVVQPGPLDYIIVTPSPDTVSADSTAQYTAQGFDENDNAVAIDPVWSVIGGIGSVDTTGLFTPGAAGSGQVRARVGGIMDNASVTVMPGSVKTVVVSPDSASAMPGDTISFTATAFDTIGTSLSTSTGSWYTLFGYATSLGGGDVYADSTGFESVVFEMDGRADTASLTILGVTLDSIVVTPDSASLTADDSIAYTATGYYSDASSGPVSPLWRSEGGVGAIDSFGVFDAVTVGSGVVIAELDGRADTAFVSVSAGSLATVTISPSSQSASIGDTTSYLARGYDGDGNEILPMSGGSWWSNEGLSTSLGGGSFVADSAGADTIAAFFGVVGDSAEFVITGATLDSITVAPSPVVTTTDSTIVFVATGHYDDASTSSVVPTWSVAGPIGTIAPDGTFDPTTPGSGTVVATRGAFADTVDVTVTRGAVVAITISPQADTIAVLDSIAFTATAIDADSNAFVPPLAWSEPTALGAIDTTGLFVASTPGPAEVLVSAEGYTDAAAIRITPGPLDSIAITPRPDTLSSDTTLAFTVTGYDALGFPIAITASWSVLGGVGSVDASGTFSGGTAGYGAVIADTGAFADTVWFDVVAGSPASLSVSPDSTGMTAGDTISFAAVVSDAQGNVVDTTVAWSADAGSIDAAGFYSGTVAGTAGVTALLGSLLDSANVTIAPGAPVSFAIDPRDTTVTADDSVSFTLSASDAWDNAVSVTPVTWTGGLAIGTLDSGTGLFDATTTGIDTIAATWTDTTIFSGSITVLPGEPATIDVAPDTVLLTAGSDSLFTATAFDADGNVATGTVTWSSYGAAGSVDPSGLFTADTIGASGVVGAIGTIADTSTALVFDGAGLRVTAVLEDRESVLQGESNIPVRIVVTNESGDRVEDIDVSVYFHIAGRGVSSQYTVTELALKAHALDDGATDTLTHYVTVHGDAETGETVTIGASAFGILKASGLPVADLSADVTGEWIVLSGLLLDDVARSFFPGKVRPGQTAAFVIQLRNEGTEDLRLRTGTRLVIDNGTSTIDANLLDPVDLPAGGTGSTARFEIETVPANWMPGTYALTFFVDGENESGVPLAAVYTAKKNALEIAPPYVHVSALGVEGDIHPPGTEGVVLARLELVNLYETDRALTSVTARNATDGSGSQLDRDGVLTTIRLVHDRNGDGVHDAADTTLGSGVFTGGTITFDGVGLTLAPLDTLTLLTTVDVSLLEAPDGTHIDVSFAGDTTSFDCGPGTIVFGADTLFSPGDHFVDGMIAAQIGTSAPFSRNVSAGARDSLALALDIPSNGYEPDTIRSLAIRNFGTAEVDLDIETVRIWLDGGNDTYDRGSGDDALLGVAAWIGEGYWSLSEPVAVPRGGIRMFVTVDVTEFARESYTIRLGIPVDGVDMTSRNDGPIDVEARLSAGRTIGSANRILFSQTDENRSGPVAPGYETQLLRFTLSNLYQDTVTVRGLSVTDASDTDSAFSIVRLYREDVAEGRVGLSETAIEDGGGVLDGFELALPPGETCTLTVEGRVATTCVSDGARLSMRIESALAFTTGLSRFVTGFFPAETVEPPVVDGFSTFQVDASTLGDGPIAPGGSEQLLFRARIPSNGCESDRFRAIEVLNGGTADQSAFASMHLEAAGADVGSLVWDGLAWVRDGFDLDVPPGGLEIEVHGSIAAGAPEGATVRVRIPLEGIDMASENDGPVDIALDAPDLFTITDAPLFTRIGSVPDRVSVGQSFDVTLIAINISTDGDTLNEIEPDLFTITGPASVVTPNGDLVDELAPGDTAAFTWTVRADAPGTVTFAANATADGPNGRETSLLGTSPPVTVQRPATGTIVNIVSAIPSSVTRGSRDLRAFVLDCSHANDAGEQYSDIDLDDLTFAVTDEDGARIDPASILDRASVQRTGLAIGQSGLAKSATVNADSTVTVSFEDEVRIVPGGGTSLVLLLDLSESSTAARFRIAFDLDTTILPRDANSMDDIDAWGNIPYLSEVVGLFNAPSGLEVSVANLLPASVNRGNDDVTVGELTLSSTGIPEETASILADNLCLVVTDSAFPYQTLSVWSGDVRHFEGSGWSTQGDTLYLPLVPALGIPANNPIRITLRGDVSDVSLLGPAQIDSSFVLIRSATSDSLPIVVESHEAFATSITERITEVDGRGQNRVPIDPVFQGSRAVPIIDLVFEPVPKTHGASAELHAITITVVDTSGAPVPVRDVAELALVRAGGERVGVASGAGVSGNALRVPFDTPIRITPGTSRIVSVAVDLEADVPRGDYRFAFATADIELEDENDGTPVTFVTTGDTLQTSVLAVREVTSRVDLYFDAVLPATAVGGGAVETGAALRVLASGEDGDATLHLAGFDLAFEDEDGSPIDPAALVSDASLVTSSGTELTLALESDRAVASFEGVGESIVPGDTLTVSVGWNHVGDPAAASYRVRIVEESVALAENVEQIGRAFDDPGQNPSGLTYFVDKQFETSLRNYPNPFAVADGTTIAFYCGGAGRVSVNVFTGLGVPVTAFTRRVDGPGLVEIFWQGRNGDGKNVISGVYLASIVVTYNDGKRDHAIHKIAVLN